jgi:hypothetical protein
MRARAVNIFSIATALGTLAIVILFGDTASAASLKKSHAHTRQRAACDNRAAMQRAFTRIIHRRPEKKVQRGVSARLQRGASAVHGGNDDEAIQNDGGAAARIARGPAHDSLEPLTTLLPGQTPLPLDQPFSRRSPRGPPLTG